MKMGGFLIKEGVGSLPPCGVRDYPVGTATLSPTQSGHFSGLIKTPSGLIGKDILITSEKGVFTFSHLPCLRTREHSGHTFIIPKVDIFPPL